jgi:hypothetical protein
MVIRMAALWAAPLLCYSKGGPPLGDLIRTIWSGLGGCLGIRVRPMDGLRA